MVCVLCKQLNIACRMFGRGPVTEKAGKQLLKVTWKSLLPSEHSMPANVLRKQRKGASALLGLFYIGISSASVSIGFFFFSYHGSCLFFFVFIFIFLHAL